MIAIAALAAALGAGTRGPAASQETAWPFDAFVYYWAASLDGDMTVDGQDVELDRGDGVSGDSSLSGFLGHFEAERGPWSFAIAPMFVRVESDGDASGGVDADVEIDAQVHEGFVAHDIAGPWQWMAGARYCEIEAEADLDARRLARRDRRVGHRALAVNFDEGSGGDRVEYDLSLYGPILGVTFSF